MGNKKKTGDTPWSCITRGGELKVPDKATTFQWEAARYLRIFPVPVCPFLLWLGPELEGLSGYVLRFEPLTGRTILIHDRTT